MAVSLAVFKVYFAGAHVSGCSDVEKGEGLQEGRQFGGVHHGFVAALGSATGPALSPLPHAFPALPLPQLAVAMLTVNNLTPTGCGERSLAQNPVQMPSLPCRSWRWPC